MTDSRVKEAVNSLSYLLTFNKDIPPLMRIALDILAWANVAGIDNEDIETLRSYVRQQTQMRMSAQAANTDSDRP